MSDPLMSELPMHDSMQLDPRAMLSRVLYVVGATAVAGLCLKAGKL